MSENIRKLDYFITENQISKENGAIRPTNSASKDWKHVRLGDIISLEYGKGLPEKERIYGKVPVVGSNGVIGYHNRALVKGPGIVIGRKGTIGAVTWIDTDFWPIDTTYYIKTKRNDIFLKWLYYQLQYLNLRKLHLADVVPGLKRELVELLRCPLPPIDEQRRIAEILSTVDEAIRLVDESITRTERLKKGLMQELLTKGIGHKEFKDTEIGRIPREWTVVRLKDVLTLKNGERPQLSKTGSIPVYGANGIMGYTEKYLVDNDFTIIIGRVGASGEVHLGTGKIWISDNAIYSDKYDKSHVYLPFLYYLLKHKELSRFAVKTTHPIITQSFLKFYKIQLPSLPEQKRIAKILLTVDKKLKAERRRKEKLERIKKALMNLLLTGKVRVKV